MSTWIAKAVVSAASVALIAMRAPHGQRSRGVRVVDDRKGSLETYLRVLPNWFVGPSYLLTFGLRFALRLKAEERMMPETFGDEYAAYAVRTKRLLPGIW